MSILVYLRRRELPVLIAGIILFVVSFGSYFTFQPVLKAGAELKTWAVLITAWTISLGVFRLVQYEYSDFKKSARAKPYSAFIALWTIFITFIVWVVAFIPPILNNSIYNFFLLDTVAFSDGTLWSVCFLSVVGASLRAFQIRNLETGVFMVCVLLWLVYFVPLPIPYITAIANWELANIAVPGQRAFVVLETLAGLAVCVRVMLGREKGFFR